MSIHEEEYKGHRIVIEQDGDALNPRSNDSLGTMVCWHPNCKLGDKHDWNSPKEFQEWVATQEKLLILPLFLYDHGGLRIKVGDFKGLLPQGHAEFDTMQVGWIYVTDETLQGEYGDSSKDTRKRAETVLRAEVEEYDAYLRGDCFAYAVYGRKPAACPH